MNNIEDPVKININDLLEIEAITELSDAEASLISGGWSSPEFKSGDEQMANESVTLVDRAVERIF